VKGLCYFFLLALVFASCSKQEEEKVSAIELSIGQDVAVRQIHFLDDQLGFACGGKRFEEGYIWKTEDGGVSWRMVESSTDFGLYSIQFTDAQTGYAGGEFLRVFKTIDGGETWQALIYGEGELPFHEVHRPTVRAFHWFDAERGYYVAGEQYQAGAIYYTEDGGIHWQFDTLNHEIRAIDFITEQSGVIGGYGYMGASTGGLNGVVQTELIGDFYTGVSFLSQQSVVAVGNNGGIYNSGDGGVNWSVQQSANQNTRSFNALDASDDGLQIIAVGNHGHVLRSSDGGQNWVKLDLDTKDHFFAVQILNGVAYLAGESGKIRKLSL